MKRKEVYDWQVDLRLDRLNGTRVGSVFVKRTPSGYTVKYVHVRWACGHEADVSWDNLRYRRTKGCHVCVQHAAVEDRRRVAFARAKEEAKAEGYTRFRILPSSQSRVSFVCPEGHEHETTLGTWRSGSRCPECSVSGYKVSKPGVLYLCHRVHNGKTQRMYGITNVPRDRLAEHARRGWQVIDCIADDGQRIADFESAITWYMKDTGLHGSIYAGDSGETEAWSYDDLRIDSISDLFGVIAKTLVA